MNRNKLKSYAPQARQDFIQAMTDRAAFYGLTAKNIEPVVEKGDVAVIGGRSHPRAVAKKRKALEDRIERHGFGPTMEALAYTWFNRLVAIRFMELHGYLDHGYRVLSHPEGRPTPEILEHAEHVQLPGLKKEAVIDLKLAGNKEGELYRLLLTAQCNALHAAIPFLFERIEDETELLLPDNLLHSDSLIRKLVGEIDEEDWQPVEIIGWLYQFYISDRKDEVIGKVVASEDIPAATQLFTPNWIVKYLVQNTLVRLWLATYPQSDLRKQMEYYIDPAEQTPEVREQLKAVTPTSLNPEELTFLDPACGSAHILVEAYDVFKAIYQERGYRAKDIPALILKKNLFGLEIDDRAAQLAAFALMMKARADDRRIFDSDAKPNILALQDSQGLSAADITHALNSPINKDDVPSEYLFEEIEEEKLGLFSKKALAEKGHVSQGDIASLLALFENAKTFGSLIQVPPKLAVKLPEIEERLDDVLKHGDLSHASAYVLKPLLHQAQLLSRQYDAVVANPPYMGGNAMGPELRAFAKKAFPDARADLYSMFIERGFELATANGLMAMVTMHSWMFVDAFESLRLRVIGRHTLQVMAHLGIGAFSELNSKVVQSTMFCILNAHIAGYKPRFQRLTDGNEAAKDEALRQRGRYFDYAKQEDFGKLPGRPLAYWLHENARRAFEIDKPLSHYGTPAQGSTIGDNERFLRLWHELDYSKIGNWLECIKGGGYRKWYGNRGWLIKWHNDGQEIKAFDRATIRNSRLMGKSGVEWSRVTNIQNSFRLFSGMAFPESGAGFFYVHDDLAIQVAAFLNSRVAHYILKAINPTLNCQSGGVGSLPFRKVSCDESAKELIAFSKSDWDCIESSKDFVQHSLLALRGPSATLESTYGAWEEEKLTARQRAKALEEELNRLFIDAYELVGEINPEVQENEISLLAPARTAEIPRLLSYAIGCMMGRYSLDKPGLIYANSGNQGFDPGQFKTFRADEDGIIPLLDTDWGIRDDATNRLVEFVGVAWPKEHLEENLKFIADSLGPNSGEQPRDTIRRYLATGFYKHHLPMYKKRPIYWLFSSGKLRAFQCLAYLHRYHEGALARMRTEYVIPLQGKLAARIEQLEGDKAKATSASHRNKLQREQSDLLKQQTELAAFEERLKHAADQKISLDLDDGVKVNYAKFGDLLAESKSITGGKDEE
jgi:type II restriction/modification system DNA methylase subunit YeeA